MIQKKKVFKLSNTLQNYAWGSKHALEKLYGINNPQSLPQAEMWMGAHPKAPSQAVLNSGETVALNQLIETEGALLLGEESILQFGKQLPYLFKILSASEPLSIQVHPDKKQAQKGFDRENRIGLAIDAPDRNYRDANHKPELIYAVTDFQAMNGFRPVSEILSLFAQIGSKQLMPLLHDLKEQQDPKGLKMFYQALMQSDEAWRKEVLSQTLMVARSSENAAFEMVKKLNHYYPMDMGILSPLLLNLITLKPGEAMFLEAGTLHAYLEGTGLEVMASSDNVLRGGLTPKHVDVPELLKTIIFSPKSGNDLIVTPQCVGHEKIYPVPVKDFCFSVISLSPEDTRIETKGAEILFCQKGEFFVDAEEGENFSLRSGESCFVSASSRIILGGAGEMMRIGCRF